MKIEESFRDLKGLLGMERLMNKTQENMEKMIALLLIVYAIALLVGENLRDYLSGYHDLVSRIDSLQVSGYHDLVFRRGWLKMKSLCF
jgi:hypothetical protein